MATDPVTRAIAGLGELGEICDIGCGAGYLSIFTLTAGQATKAEGFDLGTDKIEEARAAAAEKLVDLNSASKAGLTVMRAAVIAKPVVPEPDRGMIEAALAKSKGVISQAAAELGLSRQALYRRLEKLGIEA